MGYADFPIWYSAGSTAGNPCDPLPGCGVSIIQTAGLTIPAGTASPANVYPSIVVTDASNPTVELIGWVGGFPSNGIHALLQAPNGAFCMLVSNISNSSIANLILTNNALRPVDFFNDVRTGTWRPTNRDPQADVMPGLTSPAGGWPSNSFSSAGGLSLLSGSGEWKLYFAGSSARQTPATISGWKINGVAATFGYSASSGSCAGGIIAP